MCKSHLLGGVGGVFLGITDWWTPVHHFSQAPSYEAENDI